jgi:hypothetical protein
MKRATGNASTQNTAHGYFQQHSQSNNDYATTNPTTPHNNQENTPLDPNNPAVRRAEQLTKIATINQHIRQAEKQLQNENSDSTAYLITQRRISELKDEQQKLLKGEGNAPQ